MSDSTTTIDGFGPMPLVRPTSAADLGNLVRQATTESPLYPLGGGTQIRRGRTPTRSGTIVDMRGLDQIIDFPARDMTITVQAGITLDRLQQILTPENLGLPIDVPRASAATLGGSLAVNVSGSRRFGYGTFRDYVIGISAINDEGNEFKSGGRVVKNVAGYDLCKLLVGSMGTLGLITQVTLKLRPLAEERAILCIPCQVEQIGPLLDQLLASRTRPVILDVVNPAGAGVLFAEGASPCSPREHVVLVGYEGNGDAVKWQMQHLVKELGASFAMEARIGFTAEPLDKAMAEWSAWPDAMMTLKASMPPSEVAGFLGRIETLGGTPRLSAHAGNGIVVGHYGNDVSLPMASAFVTAWRKTAAAVVVLKCPPEWKNELNVWGPAPPDLDAMRRVKERFDPRGVFNPGRFLDGL